MDPELCLGNKPSKCCVISPYCSYLDVWAKCCVFRVHVAQNLQARKERRAAVVISWLETLQLWIPWTRMRVKQLPQILISNTPKTQMTGRIRCRTMSGKHKVRYVATPVTEKKKKTPLFCESVEIRLCVQNVIKLLPKSNLIVLGTIRPPEVPMHKQGLVANQLQHRSVD